MNQQTLSGHQATTMETNKLIKNTYMLLSMTLAFAAVMAGVAMMMNIGPFMSIGLSLGSIVVMMVTLKKADNASGLAWIFAFTGMQGASLGYILNHYAGLANGPELIMQAFGLTSVIFISLSAYAISTKKDFNFMGGFLFAGLIVVIGASLINMFVGNSVAFMAIQAAVAMLMVGLILYDTSRIVNGGETNYIRATISLFLNFINLFMALLHLMGMGNDD
ncbi:MULTISPECIES: Bax inhibitor-1/YccA family protein [unclassified Shewanella]|uniref:Bax inhibitor-1/YccA family protein n=1 Tax=unclassified Shewanella TaxID=196818 RepID=UPI000C861FC3|nr:MULTISPECIES: Bax inhibitor-1/YccA family protein [unclassified Shewanella]MDO6619234.1 Bax inhibitor-1/YccA family protein [Shewanella sp. 6_MG-2023]MDO6640846.1 Bax inhibitor-1/YccA family protein [Shewanella sp. 5_MG-2023]MDO6678894.1 Bax inhibitor-1/YccA family protein [Shewanella sp. 4_MG-2023]MDO6776156.1 Bax inhibitor-1/YccA family protein [Shewanella sp. 3_MG-2023]PMG28746.1 BAX inhibitor protein [Shewanella sp. 10N.286.52.C2]